MLYTACARRPDDHRGDVVDVTAASGSPFAPSVELEASLSARRIGWRQFERAYTDAMRTFYRKDRARWIDLVERASRTSVTLVGQAEGDEDRVWCPRRLLKEMLLAVAEDRGLMLDPDTASIDIPLLERRRREVMAAEGTPFTCPVCRRPADTARPARSVTAAYGYCSQACQEQGDQRWRIADARKNYSSGRRP